MIYYAIRYKDGDETFGKAVSRETLTKGKSYSIRRTSLKNASFWTDESEAIAVVNNSRQYLDVIKIDIRISVVSLERKR